jgi:glyoxylase-like metal-dependent hydrolase (beta-lactamase superfamily II)
MRVHHLNCGTLGLGGARFVCNVLLVETRNGLALIDTGLGAGDIERPARLGEQFLQNARPKLDPSETAIAQVQALGYRADDVRHILITHLDRDHAGGLGDFPDAVVHLHAAEHGCAVQGGAGVRAGRYVPEQWSADHMAHVRGNR